MRPPPQSQLLVLLDDATLARPVVELCSAVAQGLRRALEVVYVESAPAWAAAALPFTQELAYGSSRWQPLALQDVERGFRTQASRLRQMTERVALRHDLRWSVRVVRGALQQTAQAMRTETDLLLVAGATGRLLLPLPDRARRRVAIAVVADTSPGGQRALQVAAQLAQALNATLAVSHGGEARHEACDLLVLPGCLSTPQTLARLQGPVLLVD